MPKWTIYLVITIIIALLFFIFYRLKSKYIQKLSTILYSDNNPDLFLEQIDSFAAKIYFNSKVRLQRKLDAYVMKDDTNGVLDTFKELESKKLSFGQQVSLYEKEVDFYVSHKMFEQAVVANNKVQELNSQVEIPDLQKIADACNYLIKVYVDRDPSVVNDLIEFAENASVDSVKGIHYFRIAKCYYYKKDTKMVDKYLDKAYNILHKTPWGPFLEGCKKDHKKVLDR